MDIRIKRIINGKAYNTGTSSLVHEVASESGFLHYQLYQTKHGAFFSCWWDEDSGGAGIKPLPDDEAQKWLEDHGADGDVIEKYFERFPEGGAAESRITLRLPGNLHQRILASAAAANLSLNTYVMRLLEHNESQSAVKGR